MENKKKCFYKEHKKLDAKIYCQECNRYMCNKCISHHKKLFDDHHIYNLDESNNSEKFINLCNENNHMIKFQYYCKDHNILCCSSCITKLEGKGNGLHKDCNIDFIENIKNEKKKILQENNKYLEDLSVKLEDNITEIKLMFERINRRKEELKLRIQKIFYNVRNILDKREDELLLEIEKQYNEIFYKEEIIKKNEKLQETVRISLEKGKSIENEWYDDSKLNFVINECINIENDIKNIYIIDEYIDKFKKKESVVLLFNPENNDLEQFMLSIKNFGEIKNDKIDLDIESLILTDKENIYKFNRLISSQIKINNIKLLFRATKDEITFQSIKNKIEGQSNLIFLFFTGNKRIFGSFISSKLDNIQNKKFFEDEKAFVFNLENKKIYKVLIPEKAIRFQKNCPIMIGNDGNSNGFGVYNNNKVTVYNLLNEPKIYDFQKKNELTEEWKELTELEIFTINFS